MMTRTKTLVAATAALALACSGFALMNGGPAVADELDDYLASQSTAPQTPGPSMTDDVYAPGGDGPGLNATQTVIPPITTTPTQITRTRPPRP